MRIIINMIGVGAGNNGGSHTLIQSANTLQKLGMDVKIIDYSSPKYTWNKIEVPYIKVKNVNDINGDIIIATGFNSISTTNKSKIKNKIHWIRGWEVWASPEEKLVKTIRESKCKKVVNSICLQRKLLQYNIKSKIIRPGHDFSDFFPLNIRNNNKIIIGGLYNEGKKREKKRTEWIPKVYDILKKQHYNVELYMFGSDGHPKFYTDKYFKNPDIKTKNEIYNKVDIWLAPSELEGLHITPAEAMLTNCCVVGTNAEMSGSEDYLFHTKTGMVSQNTFYSFICNIEILMKNELLRKSLGEEGRTKILSLGDREENMKKFINLIEKMIS